MQIPAILRSASSMAEEKVLLDSGATTNFLDQRTVKRLRLKTQKLPKPHPVRNVDGTSNSAGQLTHYIDLQVKQNGKEETLRFFITNLGEDRLLLGFPWFAAFNPPIDWAKGTMEGLPIHICTAKAAAQTPVPAQ